MTPCLRPDELIDLLDGAGDSRARAHLAACAHCRRQVSGMREMLRTVETVEVPEPSPGYWPQVNAQVRTAIAADAPVEPPPGWFAWLRWDVVVPVAGLATLVMALASAVARAPAPVPEARPGAEQIGSARPGAPSVDTEAGDAALELMAALAAGLPDAAWETLGWPALPDLDVAAQSLTFEEQQALRALLQAAVERPTS